MVWFVVLNPKVGSMLTALSLLGILSLTFPLFLPHLFSLSLKINKHYFFNKKELGAWVSQLAKHLTSAQLMISWFMSSRPARVLC